MKRLRDDDDDDRSQKKKRKMKRRQEMAVVVVELSEGRVSGDTMVGMYHHCPEGDD